AGVLEPVPRGMVSKVVEPDDTLYMPYEEAIGARGFDVSPKGAGSAWPWRGRPVTVMGELMGLCGVMCSRCLCYLARREGRQRR
ncbi:MAG TPA: hypothetical protein GX510_01880, partial [Firmicutes bacterium]|nr:hypothetical protein [Candidatus Fermentithermobacillaceae bacterium]